MKNSPQSISEFQVLTYIWNDAGVARARLHENYKAPRRATLCMREI